jgi:tryptophan synthase alpha chain
MNRIDNKFKLLRQAGRKALVAYLTAGDPSMEMTKEIIPALALAGADILEVGVPFSDPTADGPVIQAASQRALSSGATLEKILGMIACVRMKTDIPIILFGYYNPIYRFGVEKFSERASAAGVDGILVVDLPPEEARELRKHTDGAGLDFISLVAPTTGDNRISRIVGNAAGFVYYISITGVTGTARPEPSAIRKDVLRIKARTNLPVAVGFGISTPQQAAQIAPLADGIVIGSALVKLIEENGDSKNLPDILASYIHNIRETIDAHI